MATQKTNKNNEKLDKILEMLTEIKTTIATQGVEIETLNVTARENKESIKGNHKPGLEGRMLIQENDTKFIKWVSGTIAVIVGGELATLVFAILTHKISLP